MIRKRPFVNILLFAFCLFCCVAQESCGKMQKAACKRGAADGKRQSGVVKNTTQSIFLTIVSKSDTVTAPICHMRRIDESEAFQPIPVKEERAELVLQTGYVENRFIADLRAGTDARAAWAGRKKHGEGSIDHRSDWLESRAGGHFHYPIQDGF